MPLLKTPVCEFGKKAPDFTLYDIYGQKNSISDIKGESGLLIMFICNHCPYVKGIISRLVPVCENLSDKGIGCAAIMPNNYQAYIEDSPDNMLIYAKKYNFTFPYLIDESQDIAKEFGAVCTPDFFGYNSNLELQYRGRLDSAGAGSINSNTDNELLTAMSLIIDTGKGPEIQYPSMGCSIKWR